MQKIKVQTLREVSKPGKKTFYVVVDENGTEFTTFDTKILSVTAGSVLEIEPQVKGKFVNITEWKVLEEGPAAPPGGSGARQAKSPEQIAIERRSIEGQTAYNGMVQLIDRGAVEKVDIVPKDVFDLVFEYARVKMTNALAKLTVAKKPAESTEKANSGGFQNAGQFLSKCQEVFDLNRSQVLENDEVKTLYDKGEFDKAYLKLAEKMAGK